MKKIKICLTDNVIQKKDGKKKGIIMAVAQRKILAETSCDCPS